MSKLTEVLKLFCYDPETDGNLTFNVTEALTKNWEKIDQLVLLAVAAAAAYDPEVSYAVGAYCTHGGKLHKCGTAIPDGEPWTAEHWTETTVAAELAEVRASLSNKLDKISALLSGTDLNTVLASGNYRLCGNGDGFTNTPPNTNAGWCLLHVVGDSDTVSQTLYMLGGDRWGRMLQSGTIWSDWRRISTATLPQEYDIPFQSGWQANGTKATYCKSQEGICIVNCSVYGTGLASNNFIASLPEGVRPSANFGCSAHAYKDGVRGIAEAQITYNGDIVIYSPIEFDYVSFSCAFVARN